MRVKYLSAISLNERIVFLKLLFQWRGSVWKLIWFDFTIFMSLYIGITLLYRFYLSGIETHKLRFEGLVKYIQKIGALVPLSFLLGFFVSTILNRWWEIIMTIPWMSKPAFITQAHVTGGSNAATSRKIRLTVMRYMNLAWIIAMCNLSSAIKGRFKVHNHSDKHSVKCCAGEPEGKVPIRVRQRMEKINSDSAVQKYFGALVAEPEIAVFETQEQQAPEGSSYKPEYWLPLQWATKLLDRGLREGYVVNDRFYIVLLSMIQDFRGLLGTLSVYNEFNIPLVYTQVVVIVVYSFFVSELFSQQFIDPTTKKEGEFEFDAYVPILSIIKFLLYMGWFKIGLSLINPLSEDQYQFPMSDILDYNLMISTKCAPAGDNLYPEYLQDDFGNIEEQLRAMYKHIPKPSDSSELNAFSSMQESKPLVFEIDETAVKECKGPTNA